MNSKLKLNMKFSKSDTKSILFGIVTTLIVVIVFFIGNWLYNSYKSAISGLLFAALNCGIIPVYMAVSKKVPNKKLFRIAVLTANILLALILLIIGSNESYGFLVSVYQVAASGFFVVIFDKFITDENIGDFRLAFLFCILLSTPFWGFCIMISNDILRDVFIILYALISIPVFIIFQFKAKNRFLYFAFVVGFLIAMTFPIIYIGFNNAYGSFKLYMINNLLCITLAHWAVLIIDFILLVFKITE